MKRLPIFSFFRRGVKHYFSSKSLTDSEESITTLATNASSDHPPNAMSKRCSEEFNRVRNHLGASMLPESLQSAISGLLAGYPRRQLRASVASLSQASLQMTQISAKSLLDDKLQSEAIVQYSAPSIEYGLDDVFAYIASQMPFALAPLQRVLAEIKRLRPDFHPQSLLDFGCGPGTAVFAAKEEWPELTRIMAIDTSQPMLEVAKEMSSRLELGSGITWRRFMSVADDRPRYDLVTCSHTLAELGDDGLRAQAVEHLWNQTEKVLVLIERGNAEGFRLIRNARQLLLQKFEKDLKILAPCPHHFECPMRGSWCHFAQRVQLTSLQTELFNLPKGFEDQKFSYLVLERKAEPSTALPRLVRPPLKRSGHVIQDACMPEGSIQRFVVAKSAGAQVFYDARKSQWGDCWPHAIETKKRLMEDMSKKPKDYPRRKLLNTSNKSKSK